MFLILLMHGANMKIELTTVRFPRILTERRNRWW